MTTPDPQQPPITPGPPQPGPIPGYPPTGYPPPLAPAARKPSVLKAILIMLGVLVALCCVGVIVAVAVGGNDNETAAPQTPVTTTPAGSSVAEPPAAPPDPVAALRSQISTKLSNSNRTGVQRLGEVTLTGSDLSVHWAINDNLTSNLMKIGMRNDVRNILQAVRESAVPYATVRVVGTFSMIDQFGNTSESAVVRLGYTKAIVDKVNFAGVDPKNLIALADVDQFVHREFQG